MQITIKLAGALRVSRFREESRAYPDGINVQHVVDTLQFPADLLGIILINGQHADPDHPLADGDVLTLLPVLDGG